MTVYLIDTNILSYLHDPDSRFHQKVVQRMVSLEPDDRIVVSVLSLYEIHHGTAYGEPFSALVESIETRFEIAPLSPVGARLFGLLKRDYRTKTGMTGRAIERHNVDLMLAANAIAEDMVLVSNDGIFTDLAGLDADLKTENWAE